MKKWSDNRKISAIKETCNLAEKHDSFREIEYESLTDKMKSQLL